MAQLKAPGQSNDTVSVVSRPLGHRTPDVVGRCKRLVEKMNLQPSVDAILILYLMVKVWG